MRIVCQPTVVSFFPFIFSECEFCAPCAKNSSISLFFFSLVKAFFPFIYLFCFVLFQNCEIIPLNSLVWDFFQICCFIQVFVVVVVVLVKLLRISLHKIGLSRRSTWSSYPRKINLQVARRRLEKRSFLTRRGHNWVFRFISSCKSYMYTGSVGRGSWMCNVFSPEVYSKSRIWKASGTGRWWKQRGLVEVGVGVGGR